MLCFPTDKFDLIITDLTMPHMTGTDLGKKIRKIKPAIPLILCTGFSEAITPEKARNLGFRKVVRKPWSMQEFAHAVREALDSVN